MTSLVYLANTVKTRPRRKILPFVTAKEWPIHRKFHMHGCVGIKIDDFRPELVNKLESALITSSLSKKEVVYFDNKTVDVGSTFLDKKFRRKAPVNMGWVTYIATQHASFDLHVGVEVSK